METYLIHWPFRAYCFFRGAIVLKAEAVIAHQRLCSGGSFSSQINDFVVLEDTNYLHSLSR